MDDVVYVTSSSEDETSLAGKIHFLKHLLYLTFDIIFSLQRLQVHETLAKRSYEI